MKLVTKAQMRELDRRTIEEFGISGEALMDRAGHGVADVVRRLSDVCGFVDPHIVLFAGRGNNGGDAFAAARHLKKMGFTSLEVWLAGSLTDITGDAFKHLGRIRTEKIEVLELPTKADWDKAVAAPVGADILVDGILGTGSEGPPRGPAVGAIQYINSQSNQGLVVSIDIPSGLNADTGTPEGDVVVADVTVTMGLPKQGLVEPKALDFVGGIEVVDIGIPPEFVNQMIPDGDKEMIYLNDLKALLPRRRRASHKGNYGHVLLIGGARGYAGAITMAARAALRSGAGLVTVLVPESIADIVAVSSMESMVIGAKETEIGSLSSDIWGDWRTRIDGYDSVLIGPGLTKHDQSLSLIRHLIRDSTVPLVLDADAISVLKGQPHWIAKANCPVVVTPHPGELAAMMAKDVREIQDDRYGAALLAVKETSAVVVLKGAGTVVAASGKPLQINVTGNPGMATGGCGDILSGMIVGLLGQKMAPFDAARLAVCLHGRAGDVAAWRKSQSGLIAGDLLEEIPYVFREVTIR